MSDQTPTIVHLDPEMHAAVKEHCRQRNTTMKKFIADLVNRELGQDPEGLRLEEPPEKKQLEVLSDGEHPVWSNRPFWEEG